MLPLQTFPHSGTVNTIECSKTHHSVCTKGARLQTRQCQCSGVARTQLMPGHSVGTLRLRVAPRLALAACSTDAEGTGGVWGMLPQEILEFLSFKSRF